LKWLRQHFKLFGIPSFAPKEPAINTIPLSMIGYTMGCRCPTCRNQIKAIFAPGQLQSLSEPNKSPHIVTVTPGGFGLVCPKKIQTDVDERGLRIEVGEKGPPLSEYSFATTCPFCNKHVELVLKPEQRTQFGESPHLLLTSPEGLLFACLEEITRTAKERGRKLSPEEVRELGEKLSRVIGKE